jgi:uncharacterized protein YuzE
METSEFHRIAPAIPYLLEHQQVWSKYDREADVLYLTFSQEVLADDSEVTDDDVILRYAGDALIGITILHASKR